MGPRVGVGNYVTGSQADGLAFLIPLHRQSNQGFNVVGASATVEDVMLAKLKFAVHAGSTGRGGRAVRDRTSPSGSGL